MTRELPSGTVTFLFSDMEGSTQLLRELGDVYDELLDLHHEALRRAWSAHRGAEINTEGDAFFVAFHDAADALAAAVEGQRLIAAVDWPAGKSVRVRMGLHSGFGRPVDDDYRALTVHQAARVVGAANGGQILATDEVIDLAGGAVEGVDLTALGTFQVRDFDEPIRLHAVSAPDLAVDERPVRVRPADRHNLLRPSTSLINRVRERDELAQQLAPGAIITLLGPGGAGKTRLSIEVGFDVVDSWPDGVWFVDLAPLTVGEVVPAAVAAAVSAPSVHGNEAITDLIGLLETRSALLVLDNCEHLIEPVARLVDELRRRCPGLGVLATSRVPLGLLGEISYRLDPLDTGDVDSDGVRLFIERSGLVADDQLVDVVRLCQAVDGLPLAIELVASRTRHLPAAELADRIGHGVDLVSTRDPTLPERQRSLDRLLDWTLELLPVDERLLLARLAVIADSFDLPLAETVGADEGWTTSAVEELVWALLDWSLLTRDSASGTTRYSLLGTVRSHVLNRSDPDETGRARRRLAEALVERLGPARQLTRHWVAEMGVELDNVRAVVADGATSDDVARSLAWSIGKYHDVTATYRTGITELARCIEQRSRPGPDLVALLTLQADMYLRIGDVAQASRLTERAAVLAVDVGPPWWDDACLVRTQGELALRSDRVDAAIQLGESALAAGAVAPISRARLWNLVALGHQSRGDLAGAAEALDHCLAAEQEAGLETFLATTHSNYAEALMLLGDPGGGARHQLAALDYARAMGQTIHIAFACMVAARLAAGDDDRTEAVRLQSGADSIIEHEGYSLYAADAQLRAELLDESRAVLGESEFTAAVEAGRSTPTGLLADRATAILQRHATEHHHHRTPTNQPGG